MKYSGDDVIREVALERTDDVRREYTDASDAALYACGPTPMMRAVHDIALAHDLPLQVSFEAPMACGIGVCLSCVLPVVDHDASDGWRYVRCCREGPVFDSRKLVWE